MLPSDDERDDSDLTEAEDDDDLPRTLQGAEDGGEGTQPNSPLLSDVDDSQRYVQSRDVSHPSDSPSDRSPSLSPLPISAIPDDIGEPALPTFAARSVIDIQAKLAAALAGVRDAMPISEASDGDDEPGSRNGAGSDQESEGEDSDSMRELHSELREPALVAASAPASPASDRSQSEHLDDRPEGDMEMEDSVHEGSVIDGELHSFCRF